MRGSRLTACVVMTLALLGLDCGKKGPPRPPLRVAGERVGTLEVHQRGEQLLLSWASPQLLDAEDPAAPRRLELFELPLERDAEGERTRLPRMNDFEQQSLLRLELDAGEVASAGGFSWVELPLDAERGLRVYGVRYLSRSGARTPTSSLVLLEPAEAPPPPTALRARMVGETVRFEVDGAERVRLYERAAESERYPPRALSEGGQDELVRKIEAYGPRLCWLALAVRDRVESATGAEACLLLEDKLAPPVPSGLVAAAAADGSVLLVWDPAAQGQVGYHVYRREADVGTEWGLLNQQPVGASRYKDTTVAAGTRYEYRVSAVDAASPPNQSDPSKPVVVRALAAAAAP